MTLDDVGDVGFLKIVRKSPRSPVRRIRHDRFASSPPLVFFINNDTETPVWCEVTPESTLTEIESIVRRECKLRDTPIQILMRMRSDRGISTISAFPQEKFGQFDLVFMCLPKLSAHLDLSSLTESTELQNARFSFDRYHEVDLIGQGAQGEVSRYRDKSNGELIAVKSSWLKNDDITDGMINEAILREVRSLMKFRHPSILPLLGYDVQIESKTLRIAMPYIGPDSLESVLDAPRTHPWLSFTSKTMIVVGIVVGMYLVHCGGIIHRDLKPTNILLDPTSHHPIIADFGLSRKQDVNTTMTHSVGTPLYMAPEIFIGGRYSNKVDIFSFGVLLYEIVTGQKPLQDSGNIPFKLFTKVTAGDRAKIPDTVEPFTRGLITRCWDGDPDHRPTFREIFCELRANRFKIFSAVDSLAVEQFLQSLL
jgi:serine/threonine protein kinase